MILLKTQDKISLKKFDKIQGNVIRIISRRLSACIYIYIYIVCPLSQSGFFFFFGWKKYLLQ